MVTISPSEDDNEYYDNDEETRRQRRNDEMVVRDVQNAREFAQFIRDEGALKYLSSSSLRGKISEKANKNPNGIVDRSTKEWLLSTSKASSNFHSYMMDLGTSCMKQASITT